MPSILTTEEIEKIVSVLDSALQSNTPAVVSALQNLVLVTSLAAESNSEPGPLSIMMNRVNGLQRDVDRLMYEVKRTRLYIESLEKENHYTSKIMGNNPTWAVYDEWDSKYQRNSDYIKQTFMRSKK